ncbi:hypothetical protein [Nocardiopsis sp. LOL_012]|uniref:hypothetical protein n=1 Tax=Nocardiopsis sp. LOL_012 TaxID=3345409 RepID=UPI003A8BAD30
MTASADAVPNEEGTADVQWTAAPMSDAAYRRLLALLFAPRPEEPTRPADDTGGGQR